MPFNAELRQRLSVLKEEFDSGLLPASIYEELCRSSILEFGSSAYDPAPDQYVVNEVNVQEAVVSTNDSSRSSSLYIAAPIMYMDETSDLRTAKANKRDELENNSLLTSNKIQKVTHNPSTNLQPQAVESSLNIGSDKRKFNKGQSNRRSYSKEEKLLVVALRDGGMSSDGIATHTAVSKSNIEKWVSEKVRDQIIAKSRAMLGSGLFSTDNITLSGDSSVKETLLDLIAKQAATANSAGVGVVNVENSSVLLMHLLSQSLSAVDIKRNHTHDQLVSQNNNDFVVLPEVFASNHPTVAANTYHAASIVITSTGPQTEMSSTFSSSVSAPTFDDLHDLDIVGLQDFDNLEASSLVLMDHATSLVNLGGAQRGGSSAVNRAKKGPLPVVVVKPTPAVRSNSASSTSSRSAPAPKKTSKLISELLEAAELYQDEAGDGSFSMDLSDVLPGKARRSLATKTQTGSRVNAPGSSQPQGSASGGAPSTHELLDGQMREMYQSVRSDLPVSVSKVSDITMSFDSAMVDNVFDSSHVSMGTTCQALRPVLNNTSFLTSFHDAASALSQQQLAVQNGVERPVPTAREAQDEEDKKVLSLLGEKRFFRGV